MSRRRMETKPVMLCLKMLLLLYSFIFWVTGVLLLSVGLWWTFMLGPYLLLISSGPSNGPYILTGTGAAIVLFGLFGCFATCRGRPWMLRLYAAFLCLVFMTELIAGISGFIFRHEIKGTFLTTFTDAVMTYDGRDDRSLAVDSVQRRLHCCGVYNYSSWISSSYFSVGGVPSSCCITLSDCSGSALRNATLAARKVYKQGCYEMVISFIESNIGIIAGVTFGIAFSQVIGVSLACCLSRFINANQYEMSPPLPADADTVPQSCRCRFLRRINGSHGGGQQPTHGELTEQRHSERTLPGGQSSAQTAGNGTDIDPNTRRYRRVVSSNRRFVVDVLNLNSKQLLPLSDAISRGHDTGETAGGRGQPSGARLTDLRGSGQCTCVTWSSARVTGGVLAMMQISDSYNQKNSLFNAMTRFIGAVNNMDQTVMVPSLLRDVPLDDNGEVKVPTTANEAAANGTNGSAYFHQDADMYSSYILLKSIRNDIEWGVLQGEGRGKERAGVTEVSRAEADEDDLEKQFHYHLNGLHAVLSKLTHKANLLTNRYKEEIGCGH